ncbi:E3 ubiquitin-protein ligase TRIM7-like isoform X2 [Ictalurus furcatus]|uniref:E3 ubiquitin-protein ligase TRIM7-like isoform X2 n=1 Tax=Ictalurus furcatus TaxID=66913 RepID=UPI002350945A|nr:E3 ubiquitin-protein ligase TRIM7-like isoform X2 [Ictalurus furcatus]
MLAARNKEDVQTRNCILCAINSLKSLLTTMGFFNKLTRLYFWKNWDIFTSDQHDQHQATEEYNPSAFHSNVSLGNPRKERGIKRVCNSEQLIKPSMSILKYFISKKSQHDPQRTASRGHKASRPLAIERYTLHIQIYSPYTQLIDDELQKLRRTMQITDYSSIRSLQQKTQSGEQVSEKAEKYDIRDYYSHASLRNPIIEEESEKVHAKFFTKPSLSRKKPLIDPQQPDFTLEKSKEFLRGLAAELNGVSRGPACLREDKAYVPEDLNKPKKSIQMPITNNSIKNLPQKNMSELPHHSKPKSEKTGGLKIPKKESQNITRPSAKVILDLNTANPTLKLSQDGRSVRTKTHKEFNSSKSYYGYQGKSKHQYNGWTCVQAREGYSTGRHYWEVDVKGKCDWRIGVVSESAPRNGFINLNTDRGYWTLRLQLGSLMAMTVPVTKLNQVAPSKIGVHLDLEESQVSFYDVRKSKHIYTFQADFSKRENIYPVFGTVETDKPLRII